MTTQTRKTTPKISVQVWRPVLESLNQKIEAACLRRDAYLNRVLAVELDRLERSVTLANSETARAYVARQLDTLDRKLVSLALDEKLVERLNDLCRRKRIVRDSFFNRIFLLLSASPKMIDRLFLFDDDWRPRLINEHDDASIFSVHFHPLDAAIDPLWGIHEEMGLYAKDEKGHPWTCPETGETVTVTHGVAGEMGPLPSVYTTVFRKNALKDIDSTGLNVYLPDGEIPDTPAAEARRKALDDWL
jgi:hypothetical protein